MMQLLQLLRKIQSIKQVHSTKDISICFDNDDAGTKTTQKIQEAFPNAKDRRDVLVRDGFIANDYNALSIWLRDEEPKITKKENIKNESLTPKQFEHKFPRKSNENNMGGGMGY
jgi:hypothetical protein